jgi:hypothetical protein
MGDVPMPADTVAAWDELAVFWDERSGPTCRWEEDEIG